MEALNNPSTNRLGNGVEADDVLEAVSASGYPLQTVVASKLSWDFPLMQEEWSYRDSDTRDLRALDILARRSLYVSAMERPKVDPYLALLVECKRAELPYVFFLSNSRVDAPGFPLVTGVPEPDVRVVSTGATHGGVSLPVTLSLDADGFVRNSEYCTTFAKCARKGKKLELSGSEAYNALVLPLSKALHHFDLTWTPEPGVDYASHPCHLALGVGVLDAPMVGVRASESSSEAVLLPWVRVVRHESAGVTDRGQADQRQANRSKVLAIDVVHKDFFDAYLSEHVEPFAIRFLNLVVKHQEALASGEGTAAQGPEPRIEPPPWFPRE